VGCIRITRPKNDTRTLDDDSNRSSNQTELFDGFVVDSWRCKSSLPVGREAAAESFGVAGGSLRITGLSEGEG
jgi:hypothetical protein